jgi:phosphocarrier protein HPr
MGLMMLAAAKGESIKLITEGSDAQSALNELGQLIQSGFGDSE